MQHSSYYPDKLPHIGRTEAIFFVDEEDRLVDCDQYLCQLLDIPAEQLDGLNYQILFDHIVRTCSDPTRTRRDLELALEFLDEQPTVYLVKRAHVSGHLRISFFPVLDAEKPQVVWGAAVDNITDVWRKITRSFEHVSSVLTELHTLISGATGMTNTLLTKAGFWESENQRPYLQVIDDTIRTMERLLEMEQQMLLLQLRPLNMVSRPLDVKFEVERAIENIRSRSGGRNITAHFPDDLPVIQSDSRRFNQVLYYLFDHVLDNGSATQEIEITVETRGESLLFSLEEPQPHLAIEEIQRSLDLRSRVNIDSGFTYSSDTICLHISSEIVFALGGRMWAENAGTRSIMLYWELPMTAFVEQPVPKVAEQHLDKMYSSAARVLIGEDDLTVARMIQNMLQREGYQVLHAINGSQIIDMAASKYPDIILLDFYLPDITGIELCVQIRQFSTVPIIMVTANGRPETIAEALRTGVDDYITKPFRREELLARVSAQLRRASMNERVQDSGLLEFGKLKIDPRLKQVFVKDKLVKFSPREYKILELLAKNPGEVVTHEHFLSRIWGPSYVGEPQHLWVYISRLRRKVENDPTHPTLIMTEPGTGYYLAKED